MSDIEQPENKTWECADCHGFRIMWTEYPPYHRLRDGGQGARSAAHDIETHQAVCPGSNP